MPLYKFGAGDVFYNQIKAHPSSSFFIYDDSIYLNKRSTEVGSFASNATNVPVGHVNLHGLNIDRAAATDATLVIGPSSSVSSSHNVSNTGFIYPFVHKGVSMVAFKAIKRENFVHDYNRGDVITGSYQLSASISRQRYLSGDNFNADAAYNTDGTYSSQASLTGSALKNSLDYARRLGDHYKFSSGSSAATTVIQIPSIFYGSEIKKGTVDLKFYMTGTLMARLRDSNYNGALIQSSGSESSAYDSQTAGVVLYKEGFIILTGSWNLATGFASSNKLADRNIDNTAITSHNGTWLDYGLGVSRAVKTDSVDNVSASFTLDFAGHHRIPTVTMLAHANKGELNYSNNQTYIQYGQTASYYPLTSSQSYTEQEMIIKNVHSSSYTDPTGSLKKTTYITKVGIYNKEKRLIGIASLAKPVKKTEERDLTFKLKLDI